MIPALILLGVLLLVGTILYLLDGRKQRDDDTGDADSPTPDTPCGTDACGLDDVCPSEMMLRCESEPIVYFDDQELDDFAGRDADDYADHEIDLWRDVLYTLQPADLMPWQRSIKKRHLTMPTPIRQEFIMLYSEKPHS